MKAYALPFYCIAINQRFLTTTVNRSPTIFIYVKARIICIRRPIQHSNLEQHWNRPTTEFTYHFHNLFSSFLLKSCTIFPKMIICISWQMNEISEENTLFGIIVRCGLFVFIDCIVNKKFKQKKLRFVEIVTGNHSHVVSVS